MRRFGGTAAAAGRLHAALSSLAGGGGLPGEAADRAVLASASGQEVLDAVVDAVTPIDGTQDAEAQRAAMGDALSEVLTQFPRADLLNLTPEQRLVAVEQFVALDVFQRFCLDVGKAIQDKAPSAAVGQDRLRQAKEYIRETVIARFQQHTLAAGLTQSQVARLATQALREAIEVFQGYAE